MNDSLGVEQNQYLDDGSVAGHQSDQSDSERYLTFILGSESYAINILAVSEISGWKVATIIPNSPDYVKGVVNLRGNIVPIIDLRIRFKIADYDYLPTTVVVILSGYINGVTKTIGFIVDAVSDVLDVNPSDVQISSDFDGTVSSHYVKGLVNAGQRVITMLAVEKLLEINQEY